MGLILGLNSAYHESAVCLLEDGVVRFAAEEERFSRIKHGKPARVDNPDSLPEKSLSAALREAGARLCDVEAVGYSFNPPLRLKNIDAGGGVEGDWGSMAGERLFQEKLRQVPLLLDKLAGRSLKKGFHWLDHHLCHAASAFFPSPFDEAAILTADGIGEIATTGLFHGQGNRIRKLEELLYPDSLGFLWEKVTLFLGFTEYDAAKVMGLAALGKPAKFRGAFRQFVRLEEDGLFFVAPEIVRFRTPDYGALEALLGPRRQPGAELDPRHGDIAASLQELTEEVLLGLAERLWQRTGSRNLCLAGGVALNCVANAVLQEKSPFHRIYIQPAANDAGTAMGAALLLWRQILGRPKNWFLEHPYLGPAFGESEIHQCLIRHGLRFEVCPEIEVRTAQLLARGAIVGWFQGRMELGPRALGNRSLLADPRNPGMKEILNRKIKHREEFRPFAPSVLSEHARDWFRIPGNSVSSDFMLLAYKVLEGQAKKIPAVTHLDGTARVQTVRAKTNPRFHRLLSEFYGLTGVPILLNTSFNDREPIVCTPADAVKTFLRTGIDCLVLGHTLVKKKPDAP